MILLESGVVILAVLLIASIIVSILIAIIEKSLTIR